MTTVSSPLPALDAADVADLAAAVAGPVLLPGDPAFAEEVGAFNLCHPVHAAVVVGATGTADVVEAVRWAARTGRRVAVQATGHGLQGGLDGAVLVSTRRMDALSVDPAARTARVGAGVRWRQLIAAAVPHGLAPLCGSSTSVGTVGFTLGGGAGPIGRAFGFAADHVRRLELVTAAGEVLDVDAEREPELFWALRGGKGNFGIVTELETGLPAVDALYGGGAFFPGADAPALLHAFREWAPTLPEDTTTSIALLRFPPDPGLPEPLRGQFLTHLRFTHLGGAARAEELLAPMRALATPVVDMIGDLPYTALDSIHMEPADPLPFCYEATTLTDLPEKAVDAVLAVAGPGVDVPLAMVEIRQLGGAFARPAAVPNAVAQRDAAYMVFVLGVPAGPAAGTVPGAVRSVIDGLAPWSTGSGLLNFLGSAVPERLRALWGEPDRARLCAVKRRYDPANLFAFGQDLTD